MTLPNSGHPDLPVGPDGIPRISQLCFFPQRLLTGDLQLDFQETLAKRILSKKKPTLRSSTNQQRNFVETLFERWPDPRVG